MTLGELCVKTFARAIGVGTEGWSARSRGPRRGSRHALENSIRCNM